jgi:hypothetical protein
VVRYQNTPLVSGAILVFSVRVMLRQSEVATPLERSFASALTGFNPFLHQPPPPAYPLYVGLGKIANFFLHDPLQSLLLLSALGSVLAFAGLYRAFPSAFGIIAGTVAALIPVQTRPLPDAVAIGLFAAALSLKNAGRNAGAPLILAATVGVLPQSIIVVLPYLLIRNWRWLPLFLGGLAICFLQTIQNIELRRLRAYIESSFEPARVFDPLGVWVIAAMAIAALTYHFVRGQAHDLARHPDVQRGGEH